MERQHLGDNLFGEFSDSGTPKPSKIDHWEATGFQFPSEETTTQLTQFHPFPKSLAAWDPPNPKF